MKKYIIFFACLLAIMWGCSSSPKTTEDHSGHSHSEEGHSHAEGEAHSHAEGEECDRDHNHDESEGEHTYGSDKEAHGDEILFTPEQAKLVGLKTVTVSPGKFHKVIKTSGQILSAQGDEVTISATTNGIVSFSRPSLNEGASVRAGESLLAISSKNVLDGDPALKAKSSYDIALREYQRAQSLIGDKLISEKEYNETKLNYENAKVSYDAFRQTTSGRGVSISTPIAGFVKTQLVSEGQYVEVGQALMTVTKNRRLQLRADVSERFYKDLGGIVSANFVTSYDDAIHRLSDLNGRVVSYGRATSGQEYYLPVNFEFDNVGQIISGSYVEIYLLGQARENVIAIPVSALTEEQGIYFVYLQEHDDAYKKQEVTLGASDGSMVEILSGLKDKDKVVSVGASHVKLASASGSIPHAHEH